MSARHTRIRRLAAQVLLAWLFALASGLVNACVIAPQAMQGQAVAAHEACGGCPDQDESGPAQGSCAKFCADESSSLPSAKQAFDPGPALAIAPLPTMALTVAEAALPALERPDGTPPPRARIPIPIVFLRLTL